MGQPTPRPAHLPQNRYAATHSLARPHRSRRLEASRIRKAAGHWSEDVDVFFYSERRPRRPRYGTVVA